VDEKLLVNDLKLRVQNLFQELGKADKKISSLTEDISVLQNQVKVLREDLEKITRKYDNLKQARVWESGHGDNRSARQKINKIVREIDKCVALLNE
jgi:peptidoglycan hydrolase CwlO-like protein